MAVFVALAVAFRPAVTGTVTSTMSPAAHVVLAPRSQKIDCGVAAAFVTQAADRQEGQAITTELGHIGEFVRVS
jgi:hypothetical protein